MTIRQLKLLATVSECRQFTSAAKRLHMTQSALSKQIIALEKELSTRLFDRSFKKATLTPEGEQVLVYARRILREHEEMLKTMRAVTESRRSQVSISAVPVLNPYGITDALLQFEKEHPDICIQVSETATADILSVVDNGQADIGVIRTTFLEDNCYHIYPLAEDEYAILVSEQHRLKDSERVSIGMFSEDHFLLMGDPYYATFYNRLFSACEQPMSIEYTDMRVETIKTYVQQNRCVTLMPRQLARYYEKPGVRILQLENSSSLFLAAITRKDEEPPYAVEQLIRFLTQRYSVRLG